MTWQGSDGAVPSGGGPADDETRTDWPPASSPEPPAVPPAPPPGPAYAPPPGYPPGYPLAPLPAMAWAPPPVYGAAAGGIEYAGTLQRFVAYLLDGLVMTLIGAGFYIIAAIAGVGPFSNLSGITSYSGLDAIARGPDAGAVAILVVMAVISAAISAAYFVFQWSGSGRATLGMRVLNLQIGNAADGRTITREAAFRRWIALGGWTGILSALPVIASPVTLALGVWELVLLVSVITSPTKQGLHDRFANTVMVQPGGGSGNGLIIGCVVIIVAIVLIPLVAIVALIFLGTQVSSILLNVGTSI
jgi:uncharacterized RDD family membrane protein YckC